METDPSSGKEIIELTTGKPKKQLVVRKHLSNYMSIGVDARIGLGFDKNRTQSVSGNKCVYCWEGCKKMFLRTLKINNLLASLDQLHQEDQRENQNQNN